MDQPFKRKTRTISVRVSEEEYKRLLKRATIEGSSSVSEYARSVLFRNRASPNIVSITLEDLVHTVDDLRRQLRTIRQDLAKWQPDEDHSSERQEGITSIE